MKRIVYLIFLTIGVCGILCAQQTNIYPPTHLRWKPISHNVTILHKSNGILNIYQMDSVGCNIHKERKLKGNLSPRQEDNYYIVYKCTDRSCNMDSNEMSEIKNALQNRNQWENSYNTITPDTAFIAVYLNGILKYYASNYDTINDNVKTLYNNMTVPLDN